MSNSSNVSSYVKNSKNISLFAKMIDKFKKTPSVEPENISGYNTFKFRRLADKNGKIKLLEFLMNLKNLVD